MQPPGEQSRFLCMPAHQLSPLSPHSRANSDTCSLTSHMSRCRTVAQEMMKSQAIYWLPGDRWNLLATSPRDVGRRLRSRLAVGAREVVTRTLAGSRVFKSPDPYLLLPPCSHQAGVDLIRKSRNQTVGYHGSCLGQPSIGCLSFMVFSPSANGDHQIRHCFYCPGD